MKAHGSLLVNKESRGFSAQKTKEGSEINERRKKYRVKSHCLIKKQRQSSEGTLEVLACSQLD